MHELRAMNGAFRMFVHVSYRVESERGTYNAVAVLHPMYISQKHITKYY